jgi:hypothetical protein
VFGTPVRISRAISSSRLSGNDKVFKEKRSGVDTELKRCLEYLREGERFW